MSAKRCHLTLVTATGFRRLALREKLIAESKLVYPTSPDLAAKWVEARLHLGERAPNVEIGIQRVDTSRALRALPHGSVQVPIEVPSFLRRFVKP